MSEQEDEKNLSAEVENKNILNDRTSILTKEGFLRTTEEEKDPTKKTNESLTAIDSAPFDQTLEIITQALVSIDSKIDVENLQLQKLDQLSEIKNQLNRLEDTSVASATKEITLAPEVTTETEYGIERNIPHSSIGHNQQETLELIEKIHTLENKIETIEDQLSNSKKRFEKIESAVQRFEDLENELPNVFKNLFNKKEKTTPEKKYFDIIKSEMQLEKVQTVTPKDTTSIIVESENSLKNNTNETLILENIENETLINDDFRDDFSKEDTKPKSNYLKYTLRIFLIVCIAIGILFLFNKFQIVDLNFNEARSETLSYVDSTLKKFIFYFSSDNSY